MTTTHTKVAVALLAVETGLAVLVTLFHYSLTAEYGDVAASALENLTSALKGVIGVALALIVALGLGAVLLSSQAWVRLTAVAIPVLMVLAVFAVTPFALADKLESQYDDAPQCQWEEAESGPGAEAARRSQRAFDSIEHVGYFAGGGSTGVGGCDRPLVVVDDVDVLQHYRAALPDAGWRVVEDDGSRLRAESEDMAFEVVMCSSRRGVVWAGEIAEGGGAPCAAQ